MTRLLLASPAGLGPWLRDWLRALAQRWRLHRRAQRADAPFARPWHAPRSAPELD